MHSVLPSVDLEQLRASVAAARHVMALNRQAPPPIDYRVTQVLRHNLLEALEALSAALLATGMPVPYRLRDELQLSRCLDRHATRDEQRRALG